MNLPNKITIIRICLIPIMIALFYMTFIPFNYLLSAVVFVIASFTDFLDGYIARKYNLVSDLGKFLDPIADKILVLSAFIIMLTNPITFGGNVNFLFYQLVGGIGVVIIVSREMIVSVLRMVASSKGKVLAAEKIGKYKTFISDVAIAVLLIAVDFPIFLILGVILYVLAVILTIVSGVFYLVKNLDVFKNDWEYLRL